MEVLIGMDVLMEDGHCEHEHSGCSSTSTIDQDDIGCWSDWSPVVDWGPFGTDTNDFHGLIESMICDNVNKNSDDAEVDYDCSGVLATSTVYEPSSTTTSEGTPPWALENVRPEVREEGDDTGLRLVHLLMAAAEALTGAHKSWDLARVILVRLKDLVSQAGATSGTNMERLAAHFTDALQGLLEGLPSTAGGPIRSAGSHHHHHHHHQRDEQHHQPSDFLAAFQLLQDMSPYVKFGHFTANQAILESVSGERRVHIIDYDIMEGVQWASLMQAMVSRKDGPPPPHLRITAITKGGAGGSGSGRKAMGSVQETGRRLVAFAASIGQPFSFGQCRLDPDEKFRPSAIKLVKGETVIANCVLHPPHLLHRSTNSVASFLAGAAALSAKIITVVEEEEGENQKGGKESGFVGKFMDELHRHSAVWDSLEAEFPMQGRARGLVERVILGPRIANAVRRAYRLREEEEEEVEGDGRWGDWLSAMGFGRVGISYFNHCQARLLLGLFNDGYKVEEDAPNKLVLGWKSRRLISTSIWSLPPPPSPPQSTTSDSILSGLQKYFPPLEGIYC